MLALLAALLALAYGVGRQHLRTLATERMDDRVGQLLLDAAPSPETQAALRTLAEHVRDDTTPFYTITLCLSAVARTMENGQIEPREEAMLSELSRRIARPGFGWRAAETFLHDYPWVR